ncbi:MAG: GGDEF domain-containing protein [Pseudomonadota bacterium]
MTWLNTLVQKYVPKTRIRSSEEDEILSPESIQRRRVAVISAFGMLVAIGFVVLQLVWFDITPTTVAVVAAGLLGAALSTYGLWMALWSDIHERRLRFIFIVFSVLVWLGVFFFGGVTGYNSALLPVFPVVAAFLLKSRDAILFTALHLTAIVVIAGLNHNLGVSPQAAEAQADNLPVTVALLMATVTACAGSALYMAYQNQRVEGQLRNLLIEQAHLAVHDYLSGMGNRVRLQQRFSLSGIEDAFDVLLIDLDGFKAINDTYGHDAGDFLIKTASARMREITDESDLLIRLGGDEFVILLEKVDGSLADVRQFGRYVIDVISRPYLWKGETLRISASIGHARYPEHGDTPSIILGLADKALYVAKEAGKACCVTHGVPFKRRNTFKQRGFKPSETLKAALAES